MRVHTVWLALFILGACGSAASAQSPLAYGMQPYPMYPIPNQGLPNAAVFQGSAPPAYYPQPQPRVMYVPATPVPWTSGPVPAQPASQPIPAPAAPSGSSGPAKTDSQTDTVVVTELGNGGGHDWHLRRRHVREEDDTNWLPKGLWDVQILGGYYCDIGAANYNWAQSSIRLGKVCTGECLSHCCGAFEGLIEINGGYADDSDFGHYFIGFGPLLRYNFVHLGSRIVPYIQAGVGFQYNDAYKDVNQPYLGSRIQLTAQGQLGLRVFLTKCCSLDLEGGFQHISDLGMSGRSDGIDAIGGMFGATFFFPCCGRH